MAPTVAMQTYAERLASFNAAHPASKKRGSSAKTAKTLRWPHDTPSIAQLAEAGFCFRPTSSAPDNTFCFLCQQNLDGWEADDVPAVEHLKLSPDCGWAINVCIEQDVDMGNCGDEIPVSEKMSEARKMTFGSRWPHESKRGWICKTQKMVDAGWYYCPTEESDDFVKCPYCNLSLDGWEPKDNPYDEHQRRSADCRFFHQPAPKNKPGRGRKARTSKASRMSTQSNLSSAMENISIVDPTHLQDDSIMALEDDSVLPSQTNKRSKKGAKVNKTTARARGKASKAGAEDSMQVSSFVEPEDDDFEVKVAPPPTQASRGRKRKSDEVRDISDALDVGSTEDPLHQPPQKRRATRTRASSAQAESAPIAPPEKLSGETNMIDNGESQPTSAPASKKAGKGGRKRGSSTVRKASAASTASKASLRATVPDDADIEAMLEADLDRPLTDEEPDEEPLQPTSSKIRRLTRTRPSSRNITASVAPVRRMISASTIPCHLAADHETDAGPEPLNQEQTRNEINSRKVSKKHVEEATTDGNSIPGPSESLNSSTQATKSKQAKTRQTSRQVTVLKQRISEDNIASNVEYPSLDINSSALGSRTVEDDTGHETDASVARTAPKKRGPKKGAKKAKVGKRNVAKTRNIEQIVQPATGAGTADDEANVDVMDVDTAEVAESQQPEEAITKGITKKTATSSKTKITKAKPAAARSPSPALMTDEPWNEQDLCESTPLPSVTAKAHTLSEAPSAREGTPIRIREVVEATPKAPSPQRTPRPNISPQSSDAENQPPSSRPSALRPPLNMQSPSKAQTIRIPLAASTPTQSPLRRNISKLQTCMPWTAVDFETLLTASPVVGKENLAETLKGRLTSPEKQLTVEEWIYRNAKKGEEELRKECERLVGRFEGEGVRALKSLEGIRCME